MTTGCDGEVQSGGVLGLYQKFGFQPRFLTPVMVRPAPERRSIAFDRYTPLAPGDRPGALDDCRALTHAVYDGLDVTREILAVDQQGLGEVVLISDTTGLAAMAIATSVPERKPEAVAATSSSGPPDPAPARPSGSRRCSTPARPSLPNAAPAT